MLQGKHSPVVLVTNGCQKGLSKGRRETVTFLDARGEVLSSVYTWVLSSSLVSQVGFKLTITQERPCA